LGSLNRGERSRQGEECHGDECVLFHGGCGLFAVVCLAFRCGLLFA
jgi:hypothetical protein